MNGTNPPQANGRYFSVLKAIYDSRELKGYPPTQREIVKATSITSTSVVTWYLNQLADRGYIRLIPKIARGISLLEEGEQLVRSHFNESQNDSSQAGS